MLMELVCSGPSIGLDGAGVLEEAIQRVRVPLVLTGSLEHHVWRVESPLLPQETASNGPRSPLSEYPIARWTKVMTSASAANTSPRKRSQRGQRAFGSKGTATTSRTFSTSNGSGDSVKVFVRCGCRPKARQMRAIVP